METALHVKQTNAIEISLKYGFTWNSSSYWKI